jgi:hypothetical protein
VNGSSVGASELLNHSADHKEWGADAIADIAALSGDGEVTAEDFGG